ncbi:MAG TPA: LemA family protein [Mycobacteriales bacterium]|nr:LemA family protein [Mycobacteriales bacterium]
MTSDSPQRTSPFGTPALGGPPRRRFPRWAVPAGIFAFVLLLLVLPAIGSYNGLVDKEEAVDTEFANLDTQLQRRYDLLPTLAEAVKASLRQEQAVFGEIARARTQYGGSGGSVEDKAAASQQLEGALARLLVIIEQYPELRSNERIGDLQVQIEGTENRIAQSRRDYNLVVQDYNKTIRRFPRSIFAGMFGFERKPLFEAAPGTRDNPGIDLNVDPTSAPAS